VIKVAAALSPVVAQLAPSLEAPLTTKQEGRRREKECRMNFIVRAKEIEQNLKTEGLEWTFRK
jgi:hypothetical protein